MSEKKPFDAAIGMLRGKGIRLFPPTEVQAAIRILKDWHKWEPLIEAAGKVDIRSAQFFIDGAANFGEGLSAINSDSSRYLYQTGEKQARALLESLPDKPNIGPAKKEGK